MDSQPGTHVLAAADEDERFLYDLTSLFDRDGALGRLHRGRTPSPGVEVAAKEAIAWLNEAARRTQEPSQVTLTLTPFQSAAGGTRVAGGQGSDSHANGWEFAAYLAAWNKKGPAGLVGTVVDSPPSSSPSFRRTTRPR